MSRAKQCEIDDTPLRQIGAGRFFAMLQRLPVVRLSPVSSAAVLRHGSTDTLVAVDRHSSFIPRFLRPRLRHSYTQVGTCQENAP